MNILLSTHPQAAAAETNAGVFVDDDWPNFAARFAIDERYLRTVLAPQPVAAPSPHRGENVPERAALVGQAIFVARRPLFVRDFLQQTFIDEPIEA